MWWNLIGFVVVGCELYALLELLDRRGAVDTGSSVDWPEKEIDRPGFE